MHVLFKVQKSLITAGTAFFFYPMQIFLENLVLEMQGWIISIIILQVYLNSHAVFVLQTLLYHISANVASLKIVLLSTN